MNVEAFGPLTSGPNLLINFPHKMLVLRYCQLLVQLSLNLITPVSLKTDQHCQQAQHLSSEESQMYSSFLSIHYICLDDKLHAFLFYNCAIHNSAMQIHIHQCEFIQHLHVTKIEQALFKIAMMVVYLTAVVYLWSEPIL